MSSTRPCLPMPMIGLDKAADIISESPASKKRALSTVPNTAEAKVTYTTTLGGRPELTGAMTRGALGGIEMRYLKKYQQIWELQAEAGADYDAEAGADRSGRRAKKAKTTGTGSGNPYLAPIRLMDAAGAFFRTVRAPAPGKRPLPRVVVTTPAGDDFLIETAAALRGASLPAMPEVAEVAEARCCGSRMVGMLAAQMLCPRWSGMGEGEDEEEEEEEEEEDNEEEDEEDESDEDDKDDDDDEDDEEREWEG